MTTTLFANPVQPGEPHAAPPSAGPEAGPPERRGRRWLFGFWAIAFVAFLIPAAGKMTFETKLGVVTDPWKFIGSLGELWQDQGDFGGLADQYIGYLFPMLPYYALTDLLQIPVWMAERLWLSLVVTAAFWGALRLAERLGFGSPGSRLLGAAAYALWPTYTIIVGSTSAGVLPGAVLPWVLLPLADHRLSARGAAARSALIIPFMGGVNAASTLAALLPALLYVLTRPGVRRGALLMWWLPGVALATLWWVIPLLLLGVYGENFLPFIESADNTTSTMAATEMLRGTGNWVAYLNFGEPWLPAGWTMATAWLAVIGSGFAAAIGLAGLARRDLPERRWLVLTVLTVALITLAGYGGALGAPFAGTVEGWLDSGLSPFRNIYKFQPGVALALAFGIAHATSITLAPRGARAVPGRRLLPAVAAALVLPGLLLPYLNGDVLQPGAFDKLPRHWERTADYLEEASPDSRALVVPATTHGTYTWGKPIDQPLDVLAESRWAQRDYVPFGTAGSRRAMDAVDQALMTGGEVPGLAAFLGRAGLHHVVVRNDLDPEQIGYIPPTTVKRTLESSGYEKVEEFGPKLTGGVIPEDTPLQVEGLYSSQRAVEIYAPVAGDAVRPGPVGAYAAGDTAVVSGGPEALLQLSADPDWANRAAVLAGDGHPGVNTPKLKAQTDGLRRNDTRFGVVNNNTSYTYTKDERNPSESLQNPGDQPKMIVPSKGIEHQTTAALRGAESVTASTSGNWLFHMPQFDPVNAFDGNPDTGWAEGNPDTSSGEWLRIDFTAKEDIPDSLRLTPLAGDGVRPEPTRVRIETERGSRTSSLDGGDDTQSVKAPPGDSRWLRVTILETEDSRTGFAGAGFAEVEIEGVQVTRMLRLPAAGEDIAADAETISLHRGSDPGGLNPAVNEIGLHRQFNSGAGDYRVTGSALPVQGPELDELFAKIAPEQRDRITVTADSTNSLSPALSPRNLVDSDLTTAWMAGDNAGLHLQWPEAKEISELVLAGAGGLSTRPTEVEITTTGGTALTTSVDRNGWVRFPPVKTDHLDITITETAPLRVHNPFADEKTQLPVGLTEIYLPELSDDLRTEPVDPEAAFALPCGEGPTVSVDGQFHNTKAEGLIQDLVDRRPVDIELCAVEGGTGPLSLNADRHTIEAGDAGPLAVTDVTLTRGTVDAPAADPRTVEATDWAGDERSVAIGAGSATYLTMYENFNDGWKATLKGKELTSVRLDGWQQGFLVPKGASGEVVFEYEPRIWYDVGLFLALGALLLLAGLAFFRARKDEEAAPEPAPPAPGWWLGVVALTLVAIVVAGPYALIVPALALLARAVPALLAPIALVAMAAATLAAAIGAGEAVRMDEGPFGGVAQALALLALAAALVSVHRPEPARTPAEPGEEPTATLPAYVGAPGAGGAGPVAGAPAPGSVRAEAPGAGAAGAGAFGAASMSGSEELDPPTTRIGRQRPAGEEPSPTPNDPGLGEGPASSPTAPLGVTRQPGPGEHGADSGGDGAAGDTATPALGTSGPADEPGDRFVPTEPITLGGAPEDAEPADAPPRDTPPKGWDNADTDTDTDRREDTER